jgi:glycosyltransferase involved in cell wall biosynthesis
VRVAVDLRPLQTASSGRGVGTYVRHLTRALRARRAAGDEVVGIVAAGLPADAVQTACADRIIRLGGPVRGRILLDSLFLPRLLAREAIDVYHAVFYAPPARRPRGVRIVQTVHDLTPLRFPAGFTWRQRRVFRAAFRRARVAARVIAVSGTTRDDLVRLVGVPASRIDVIFPGVDPQFRPDSKARHPRPFAGPYLLHVGGYDPIKNLPVALRALRRLRADGFPHRLVIAGDPGRHAEAFRRSVADIGVDDAVLATGFVGVDRLADLYRFADLVVYPSLHEGFGLPPLEAMACGAPVIAARAGSLPEVLGDAAVLVDPGDPEALATAAARLLRDPAACDLLRARGHARAALYRWEEAADRTWDAYRAAAAAAP